MGKTNTTLKSFLQELLEVFPDEPGTGTLRLFLATYDTLVTANKQAPMDMFLETMAPHEALIAAKDAKLFRRVELPGGVSLKEAWKKASEATRAAVWQYLQMLYMLAKTASSVPPHMLNAIEGLAGEYAGKISSGELDISAVTSMLLGGGGGGGLGGLDLQALLNGPVLGGGGPEAAAPKK